MQPANNLNSSPGAGDCYIIPYQDKHIIYRPLLPLAFMANRPMVHLAVRSMNQSGTPDKDQNSEAWSFLDRIGFFEPDPPAPPAPAPADDFRPTVAVLFLTTRCNFRCTYCYASAGDAEGLDLSFETGCRAIDAACRNAVLEGKDRFTLGFHGGGEPSLALETMKRLLAFAHERDLPCHTNLTTNGFWSDDQRNWLFEHIDEFSLSFDGLRELQDRQRPLASGQGSHAQVMATIRAMDEHQMPYGIRLTVTEEGLDRLPENAEFLCRETECATVQIEPAFHHGRACRNENALKSQERFVRAFLEAYDIGFRAGRHFYYSGARPWTVTSVFCQAQETALIVGPDGFLTACYEVYGPEHPLAGRFLFGRLGDDGALVIDREKRMALIRDIQARRSGCRDCFCYWHCAGDCPSKTLAPGNSGFVQDSLRCEMNREITKELILRRIAAGNGLWLES